MSTTPSVPANGIGSESHEWLEAILPDLINRPLDQEVIRGTSGGGVIQGNDLTGMIGMDEDAKVLQALLDRITYKKGYVLEAVPTAFHGFTALKLTTPPLQDTYHPDDPSRVGPVMMMFPCYMMFSEMPEGAQIDWVRHCLIDAETHELEEWFRVDGKMARDPHSGRRWND